MIQYLIQQLRSIVASYQWTVALCSLVALGLVLLASTVALSATDEAVAASPPSPVAPAAAATLSQALDAYRGGDYLGVIELTRPLLYPTLRLSTHREMLLAYKILGISYLFIGDKAAAKKEFQAILAQSRDFQFEPLADPVEAVELFSTLRRENAVSTKQILRREQQEQRSRVARGQQAEELGGVVIERTVTERMYWLNFVPFGAGQFQNGQTQKGFVFLGSQLGLGALSLGTALALRFSYPSGSVPSGEKKLADTLQWTQLISGGLCIGSMLIGVLDALYFYQPQSVTERRRQVSSSLQWLPFASVDAMGLSAQGRF